MTVRPLASRLLGAATVALALTSGLSGCGPRADPATSPTTPSPTTASPTTPSSAASPDGGTAIDEDALDALGSTLTEATAAAELVEQEMAQDEED